MDELAQTQSDLAAANENLERLRAHLIEVQEEHELRELDLLEKIEAITTQ
jgi:hypothetical protein